MSLGLLYLIFQVLALLFPFRKHPLDLLFDGPLLVLDLLADLLELLDGLFVSALQLLLLPLVVPCDLRQTALVLLLGLR